jgi:hypothetical protein
LAGGGGVVCHFLLQGTQDANVVHPALLIQGGDGFGPWDFTRRSVDSAQGNGFPRCDGAEHFLHQFAAIVDLGNDAKGLVLAVELEDAPRPGVGACGGAGVF